MSELTVTLNNTFYKNLVELAETSGETVQIVLDKAIESYRRHISLEQANEAFAALRQSEELWQEELAERVMALAAVEDRLRLFMSNAPNSDDCSDSLTWI